MQLLSRTAFGVVVWSVLAGAAPAQEHAAAPLCLDQLAHMSWDELEQLYRQAEPGRIKEGYARGQAIYCPDERFAGTRSKITHLLWHGKHFNACESMLINQWCGVKAIKAQVSYGPSWLDGKPSIIMDYRETSHVWRDVRDEIREVAPGVFLGIMFQERCTGPKLKMYFALETKPACE